MPEIEATELLLITGRGIKAAREFNRLSQRQLAEKIGVKQSHIAEWEKGKDEMSKSYAVFIAKALGVEEVDLTADEFLFIKNGVRVLVEGGFVLRRTPVQCLSDDTTIHFDPGIKDTPENRKQFVVEAEVIAEQLE